MYQVLSAEGDVEGVDEGGECGAGDGAEEGYPGVGPAAVAFASDWQEGVGEARAEVSGRIYGIARGAAKRHAYHHNEEGDRERSDRAEADFSSIPLFGKEEYDENQYEGADDFGYEIAETVFDGRNGGEHTELGVVAFCGVEVVFIEQIYSGASEKRADELRNDVGRDHSPFEFSGYGETKADCGIEMSSSIWPGDEYTAHHSQTPGYGHYYPPGSFAFRLFESGACYNAAAKQYHDERSQKLKEALEHKRCFRIIHKCRRFKIMRHTLRKAAAHGIVPAVEACGDLFGLGLRPESALYAPLRVDMVDALPVAYGQSGEICRAESCGLGDVWP